MAHNFSQFDAHTSETIDWLEQEFATIRTGRATPAILEKVQVTAYGARVPLAHVASIGVEDPRTLRVSVWDTSQISQVEQAIMDANLGLSVSVDDRGVRASFPELTGERRAELMKIAKARHEDARISVRSARDEEMKRIEESDLSEDEAFRAKEELQKRVDDVNKKLNELLEAKEKEMQQ